MKLSDSAVDTIFSQAEVALRSPLSPAGEYACRKLLEIVPNHPQALNYVGGAHIERDEFLSAESILRKALEAAPAAEDIRFNYAMALARLGNFELSKQHLLSLAKTSPALFEAKLLLGDIYFELKDEYRALAFYFNAINTAQGLGHWREERSIPPSRRHKVLAVMRYIADGRRNLFNESLAGLRDRFGRDSLDRVEKGLAYYLLDAQPEYVDARQRPSFFYLPGLPTSPYLDRSLFPWVDEYEANTPAINAELMEELASQVRMQPVHQATSEAELNRLLYNPKAAPRWDAVFFYRHGHRFPEAHEKCPATSAALERLPLGKIRDHGPEILFSVLTPGTHIKAHSGVTNTRIVTHLPLMVPENCALRVADVTHAWKEGTCVMFDDTYEHEAWNRGSSDRVVLIADVWNPHMTEVECEAVKLLVETIGDFNQATEVV